MQPEETAPWTRQAGCASAGLMGTLTDCPQTQRVSASGRIRPLSPLLPHPTDPNSKFPPASEVENFISCQ